MTCLNISFLGDIFLGQDTGLGLDQNLTSTLASSDYIVGNLEGPLSYCESGSERRVLLGGSPAAAKTIKSLGVDAVVVANNHAFDAGWEGFSTTLLALGSEGIAAFGAGRSLAEALQPHVLNHAGMKVAFLAYAGRETDSIIASAHTFGVAPLELDLVREAVVTVPNEVASVIILVHWGYCEHTVPSPEQVRLARELTAIPRVSAVIGHHSHTVQGVQLAQKAITAYSLGNFAFRPFSVSGVLNVQSRDNKRGMVLTLRLDAAGHAIGFDVHHIRFTGKTVELDTSKRTSTDFRKRSRFLGQPNYEVYWKWQTRKHVLGRIGHWLSPTRITGIRGRHIHAAWSSVKRTLHASE